MAPLLSKPKLTVLHGTQMSILTNPQAASLKRIAWAYGCAKKGSDEESALLDALLEKVRTRAP